ncbi:MAG: amino acid adenylation domain-containing protein, partial [Acidobacteriota bacterium]
NEAALEYSIKEVIKRHEVLRTSFITIDGKPAQIISDEAVLSIRQEDLSYLPSQQQKTIALKQIATEAKQSFNLSTGPLLRVSLFKLAEQEHILLLSMHHIISDGWSMDILTREVATFYKAYCNNRAYQLSPLPVQYADYALWQREWLQGEVLKKQLSYWKKKLMGNLPVLQLPTSRPRSAIQSFQGAHQTLVINRAISESIKSLGQENNTTLFITMLAVFKVLLYRYTGQADIVVGTPIANRNRAEIEGLIGFFVNTLVLRTDLSGSLDFLELLERARETCLGAYNHQDLPFEKLVEELQPERDLSHTPLFQVMFVLQNTSTQPLPLGELELEPLEIETGAVKFDLILSFIDTEGELRGIISYRQELFDEVTILRMAGHIETILTSIVTNPRQSIKHIPILAVAEQQQLLIEWNNTNVDITVECVHHLFEKQVERTPNAIALTFADNNLSYRELNLRANQLADFLRLMKVEPEQLIGICVERSIEMVIGLLGILKAGGVFIPIDPTYPQERITFILQDTRLGVLLITSRVKHILPKVELPTICLDGDWQQISLSSQENPSSPVTASNTAYVLYTSGSTGQPKGTIVSHQSLVNYLFWVNRILLNEECYNIPFLTRFTFDAFLKQLFAPLIRGDKVYLFSDIVSEAPALVRLLTQEKDIYLNTVPSLWHVVLTQINEIELAPIAENLKGLLLGGEQLPRELVEQTFEKFPEIKIFNLYGPTETTANATMATVKQSAIVTIGKPIANTQVYVLDANLQPLPVGIDGELHIGGEGLAQGYLNCPALTAEKFIPNPFSTNLGTRLYKTGDMVRYLPDGNILFIGRIDDQIKIRGFRIELGEIQEVLSNHPDVENAVVMVVGEEILARHLIAYLVFDHKASVQVNNVKDYLREKLPDYMIPSTFVVLDKLPLTSNGKIDRRALPTVGKERLVSETEFVPPRNNLELKLISIWEEVLDIGPIGIQDDFFRIGGHSLLAVKLMAKIEKEFNQRLSLATLFQAPTIEKIAAILDQDSFEQVTTPLVGIQTKGDRTPFFCVHPGYGNVFCYVALARCLGSKQPFYGLQARGFIDAEQPLTTVEEMATSYLAAIRNIQPHGPYLLGGWSFGGYVAFEMAQQLQAEGEQVSLLALIDTIIQSDSINREDTDILIRLAREANIALTSEELEVLSLDQQFACFIEKAKLSKFIPPDVDVPQLRRFVNVFKANLQAKQRYLLKTYFGTVTVFRAKERADGIEIDSALSWQKIVHGNVNIYDIPGSHYSMLFPPYVVELAQILGEKILEALRESVGR